MNGKIPILLIKLNKSSLELPLVLFFLLTVLSEKHVGVLIDSVLMQQALERSLKKRRHAVTGKVLSCVHERNPFSAQILHVAAVFPGSNAPQVCLPWPRRLPLASDLVPS